MKTATRPEHEAQGASRTTDKHTDPSPADQAERLAALEADVRTLLDILEIVSGRLRRLEVRHADD
jgi:hypothetical protein